MNKVLNIEQKKEKKHKNRSSNISVSDQLIVRSSPVYESKVLPLSFDRKVAVNHHGDLLEILTKEGIVELKIRVTEDGPIMIFEQSKVEIRNSGDIKLECENLDIKAKSQVKIESGKDMEQRIGSSFSLAVRDDANFNAQNVEIKSELGDLSLEANDDVTINGLRVLMNVPSDEELAKEEKELRSIRDILHLPFRVPGTPARLPKSKPKKRDEW